MNDPACTSMHIESRSKRTLDASWSQRLDELGVYTAAAEEEAHCRAMRAAR
jgi:hypothetical protein